MKSIDDYQQWIFFTTCITYIHGLVVRRGLDVKHELFAAKKREKRSPKLGSDRLIGTESEKTVLCRFKMNKSSITSLPITYASAIGILTMDFQPDMSFANAQKWVKNKNLTIDITA